VPHDLSCYHIADEYSFSATEHPIDPHEKELLAKVGQVFIHSAAMLEKKGGFNPNTLLAPNGVDYESFARAAAEPEDLRAAPRPRIGYVGIIKRHLDLELLRDLAGRHPNWSFVMVGPVRPMAEDQGRFDRLAQVPNVRFLGGKAWHEVAAYMRHMDVCIMPYKVDGYTKYIYPLKLHEYLATGRPVVASRIPPLEPFADVVGLADTPEHWSHALQESLAAEAMSPGRVEQRQRTAKGYDWNGLVLRIGLELCRRLGPSFVDRLRAATAAETFEAGARLGARSRPAHVSG
jgi:glycosyltransferase involved in cell wall biosynthesis